jgi:hypothetical protein
LSFILSPQISCVLVELNSLNNILLFILKIWIQNILLNP